jgi:hypothetical protein
MAFKGLYLSLSRRIRHATPLIKPSGNRHFDEASLPFPQLQPNEASIYASKLNRHTNQPVDEAKSTTAPDATVPQASATEKAPSAATMANATVQKSAATAPEPTTGSLLPSQQTENATAPLKKVAPPQPEDEANLTVATEELLNLEGSPPKQAKTVHLPPKDVQEERLREQEAEKRHKSHADSGRSRIFALIDCWSIFCCYANAAARLTRHFSRLRICASRSAHGSTTQP